MTQNGAKALFEALKDNHTLESVEIDTSATTYFLSDDVLDGFYAMLEVNPALTHISFGVSNADDPSFLMRKQRSQNGISDLLRVFASNRTLTSFHYPRIGPSPRSEEMYTREENKAIEAVLAFNKLTKRGDEEPFDLSTANANIEEMESKLEALSSYPEAQEICQRRLNQFILDIYIEQGDIISALRFYTENLPATKAQTLSIAEALYSANMEGINSPDSDDVFQFSSNQAKAQAVMTLLRLQYNEPAIQQFIMTVATRTLEEIKGSRLDPEGLGIDQLVPLDALAEIARDAHRRTAAEQSKLDWRYYLFSLKPDELYLFCQQEPMTTALKGKFKTSSVAILETIFTAPDKFPIVPRDIQGSPIPRAYERNKSAITDDFSNPYRDLMLFSIQQASKQSAAPRDNSESNIIQMNIRDAARLAITKYRKFNHDLAKQRFLAP